MAIDKTGLRAAFKYIKDNPREWNQGTSRHWWDGSYPNNPQLCFLNHYLRIRNVQAGSGTVVATVTELSGIHNDQVSDLYDGGNDLSKIERILTGLGVFLEYDDKGNDVNNTSTGESLTRVTFDRTDLAWVYLKAHDVVSVSTSDLRDAFEFADKILEERS